MKFTIGVGVYGYELNEEVIYCNLIKSYMHKCIVFNFKRISKQPQSSQFRKYVFYQHNGLNKFKTIENL